MSCCPKPGGLEAFPSLARARVPHQVWAKRQKQEFKKIILNTLILAVLKFKVCPKFIKGPKRLRYRLQYRDYFTVLRLPYCMVS